MNQADESIERRCEPDPLPAAYPLLLMTIGLIVYGSLYPWTFAAVPLKANPLVLLAGSWPKTIDRFLFVDSAINALMYMPLGMFAFLTFRQRGRRLTALIGTLALGLALSVSVEILQLFDKGRITSALDVASNISGTAFGIAAGWLVPNLLYRVVKHAGGSPLLRISGAVLLIFGWAGYQGFPFMPAISRTQLRLKVTNLIWAGPLFTPDVFVVCAEWLAIASLLECVLGRGWVRKAAPWMWLLVPAKLLIEDRTFTWSEFAGAVVACLVTMVLPVRQHGRVRFAAGALMSALLLNGLAPFHFAGLPVRFSWIPFQGFLQWGTQPGMILFLRKSFWYGATIWLIRETGILLPMATAATMILLAGIELLQMWLPGRSAEITDPVLALLLGLALWLADKRADASSSQADAR